MFGGVAFELLAETQAHGGAELPADCARHCILGVDGRAAADVVCAVHRDPALLSEPPCLPDAYAPGEPGNVVRWRAAERGSGSLRLRAPGLEGELTKVAPRRYALTARVAPSDDGMLALLRGVSAAIVHRERGVVLHAAAAELDGRAVLFVGPSGAGKSTAVRHTRRARCFAFDHVAVLRGPDGWLAWGLPGGSAVDTPAARGVAYPLAAILRVRQARQGEPQITPLRGAQALFALRESVEWADDSPASEDVYLRAVMELSSQVQVGSIATVLGRDNDGALAQLLGEPVRRSVRS